ncbi:hypothetical protein SAMN05720766_1031 [Fibrobacter sp. UWH9]|uniref:hypothetical protein n=1 Tax=Fibrobacter sp. UWH9 TaxID=1896213 RepID=UPI0009123823|nr:hypothetical protein [Fibrobacter sp. UWH9]SHG60949.1 hypothetical protein SAMN05720766_1031 [Fibrobacter sp. UWH9]
MRIRVEYDSYIALFGSLKETWKGVKPKIQGDKLIVEIQDSTALSNGERDIIVFLAMLERAKNVLNKKQNILIIDEIFDYLDDANYTAAYYYILEFIYKLQREDKTIYPIIMSHLNPDFFDHFPKDSLRVYYLNPQSVPTSSENILKVLRVRESKLGQGDDYISKYMLHFYDPYDDSINDCLKNELKIWQGKILNFKNSCKKQMDAYLKGESTYDAVAVCIWLRECIERYVYDRLNVELRKQFFDGPQAEGTRSKLIFAERHDVSYPKSFSILAPIYNDPLHIGKSGETKDLRQTLFSRLHNNTIRGMIEKIANGIELEF